MIEPDMPHISVHSGACISIYYGACTMHARSQRLQADTHKICNTYCFTTATMVSQTHVIVVFYVHYLTYLKYLWMFY